MILRKSPSGKVTIEEDCVRNGLGMAIPFFYVKVDDITEGEFRLLDRAEIFFKAICEHGGEKLDDPIEDMVSPTSYQNLHAPDQN